jgi:hypothetical protein
MGFPKAKNLDQANADLATQYDDVGAILCQQESGRSTIPERQYLHERTGNYFRRAVTFCPKAGNFS